MEEKTKQHLDAFLTRHYWLDTYDPHRCLLAQAGMDGDDAFEFMEAYAEQLGVDMDDYCWYFHHYPEGVSWIPFYRVRLTDGTRWDWMPITYDILLASAKAGAWTLTYPEHTYHDRRWVATIGPFFLLMITSTLAGVLLAHCIG